MKICRLVLTACVVTASLALSPATVGAQPSTPAPAPLLTDPPPLDGPTAARDLPGANIPSDISNDPGTSPEFFNVNGNAVSNTWRYMRLVIASFVGNSAVAYPADVLRFRVTVTPTSTRPLVQYNCVYDPVSSEYPYLDDDTHMTIYMIVNGVQVDFQNTDSFPCDGSTRSWQIDNNFNYANQTLEVGVRAWTQTTDTGEYLTVGAKTAPAVCDPVDPAETTPGQGTICRFS
ncbi:MAG: hypothetical protein WBA00_12790 [Rhodococcus sp. (in: high G+C Gram-positive bacteria)]